MTSRAQRGTARLVSEAAQPTRPPCARLGPPTGGWAESGTGKARLKVHVCGVHRECVLGRPDGGLAGCDGCPDYAPTETAP